MEKGATPMREQRSKGRAPARELVRVGREKEGG